MHIYIHNIYVGVVKWTSFNLQALTTNSLETKKEKKRRENIQALNGSCRV